MAAVCRARVGSRLGVALLLLLGMSVVRLGFLLSCVVVGAVVLVADICGLAVSGWVPVVCWWVSWVSYEYVCMGACQAQIGSCLGGVPLRLLGALVVLLGFLPSWVVAGAVALAAGIFAPAAAG